jgi:hypothetical protein
MTVVDATHIELQGAKFVNAYISGGIATDITAPAGRGQSAMRGLVFEERRADLRQSLDALAGAAGQGRRSRASVKNRGQAGPQGVRWRIDITDPVYRGSWARRCRPIRARCRP